MEKIGTLKAITAVTLLASSATTATAAIQNVSGFIVQRDDPPPGTHQQAFPNSNLQINGTSLTGTAPNQVIVNGTNSLHMVENQYDNDPSQWGFSANRTNAWLTDDGSSKVTLNRNESFDISVTVNLDAGYTDAGNNCCRKEAGFRLQNPNDPAANSLLLVTTDNDEGEVGGFGISGAYFPKHVFGTNASPVTYTPGTSARIRLKYTAAGADPNTQPATYEYFFDAGADGIDVESSGAIAAEVSAGLEDGTKIGLFMQAHVADNDPAGFGFGDATSFANDYIDSLFTDLYVYIDGDYDGDGLVAQGDLSLVLQNWGVDTDANGIPAGWDYGDPTGTVDQNELSLVLQNWGNTFGSTVAPANLTAPVFTIPEPVSALVFGLGSLALIRRNRSVDA
ncbi:hypothetical protein [Poriferisphaera sp. WC338]|uniref:hypothetical protein n=1 Tax=Poriferisphaera sp. WC338 TaxID=3425129 RepID=UPI003D819B28